MNWKAPVLLSACAVLASCEIGRLASTLPAASVCLIPDAGRPERGEGFLVRALPGFHLDAGCSTALDGGALLFVVSGINVAYFPHAAADPPALTCTVPPLAPGRYVVSQGSGSFSFEVSSGDAGTDAGFPPCP